MVDRHTKRYVGIVAVTALLAVALTARVDLGLDEYSLHAAGFFALLGALAGVLAYNLPRGAAGNISFIPLLSAAVIAPGLSVVVACTLAVMLAEILHRRELLKAVFNISQTSLSVASAVLTYHALGGQPLLADFSQPLLPFVLAFAVFFAVNTACVSGVIAVSQHQRFSDLWWQNTRGALMYDIFAIPAVYGFAYVYARFDAGWCAAFALPLFGLRQLYKTNWQLEKINEEFLQLMVAAIEARDPYTSGHSQRVSEYSQIVARAAGIGSRSADRLAMAALLHDIGKIHEEFAPILRKPGRLTSEEFEIMKSHSEKGARLVAKVSQFHDLVDAIRGHHEAWNGSGYPDGLSGTNIPSWARVIAFADTIDAMTTDRPYREALDASAVCAELLRESGRQFDPSIANRLTSGDYWVEMSQAIARNLAARSPVADLGPAMRISAESIRIRA